MSIFGTIKTGGDVETAVLETLAAWMPTYLAELALQQETAVIATPTGYYAYSEFDLDTDGEHPPVIVVESPGLDDVPVRLGDGSYIAKWRVNVVAVAKGDRKAAMARVRSYVAAARAIMLQQSSLGGRARGVTWDGEGYDEIPVEAFELQAGRAEFVVEVADVVMDATGPNAPADPVTQPGSNWPTADDVAATLSPSV